MLLRLDSAQQCSSASFAKALKEELENLPSGTLPLEQATSQGGFVDDSDISVTVIQVNTHQDRIQTRIGIFFTEIITGCGCGDDPIPANTYCEMLISIDTTTSEAEFDLIQQ